MELCPDLADEVRTGCARNDAFCVLHAEHAERLATALQVDPTRVHVVGAGFAADRFHARGRGDVTPSIAYAGKYSLAKGLPQLLDAFENLRNDRPELVLHIAGDGAGEEAERLRARMKAMAPAVVLHGMLDQFALGELLRTTSVFVLPSFYEGLPLVLVEALACGCRLVSTDLPGVRLELAPHLAAALDLVALPRRIGPDTPDPRDLPAFVEALSGTLADALTREPLADPARSMPEALEAFGWPAVFARVQKVWEGLRTGR